MRISLEITNADIAYAEKILLKEWEVFDSERRDFIKNIDTIDLQAVPWSWKTTALLAKLLILETKMPFPDGSGILVLSHTNTAVDEIKEKLELIAPKLFKFPNFIGTIQSFVDEFLAKPYYINTLSSKLASIDNDVYLYNFYKSFPKNYLAWIKHKFWNNNTKFEEFLTSYQVCKDTGVLIDTHTKMEIGLGIAQTTPTYKNLIEIKILLYKKGFLNFNDAYYLWNKYMQKYTKIIKNLQNRFWMVFVDEMQDMGPHQVDILEEIFYQNGDSTSKIQRIGDINQSIFDEKTEVNKDAWKWRDIITVTSWNKLELKWTHRLTQATAKVVKNFAIDPIEITGKRILKKWDGGHISDIKPVLLVYKNEHLNSNKSWDDSVLEVFSKLILEKKDEGYFQDIKDSRKFICKAVLWNAKPQENQDGSPKFEIASCRAKHYHNDYDVVWGKSKKKTWFQYEKDYLFYYDKVDNSFGPRYKNIMNLLLRILRSNDLNNPNTGTYFTKHSFFEFLQKKDPEKYKVLQTKLYSWSRKLTDLNIDAIAREMDDYFFDDLILEIFWKSLHKRISISEVSTVPINLISDTKEINLYKGNGIDIQVWTVHSVKWETHTCTLYLETSSKGYESTNKIKSKSFLWICWTWIKPSYTASHGKQAMKMLYVWLSRPTHLLCYAIHEDRYNILIDQPWNKERLEELWDVKIV